MLIYNCTSKKLAQSALVVLWKYSYQFITLSIFVFLVHLLMFQNALVMRNVNIHTLVGSRMYNQYLFDVVYYSGTTGFYVHKQPQYYILPCSTAFLYMWYPVIHVHALLVGLCMYNQYLFDVVYYSGTMGFYVHKQPCLLYTSPSPRDATLSRIPSSA